MLNEAIQTDRVRLAIKDEKTGKSTSSIVTINEALEKARSMKLDLVLGEFLDSGSCLTANPNTW